MNPAFGMVLLLVVLSVLAAVVLALAGFHKHKKFLAKYPPISDDEFMERLPEGTNRSRALRVRAIFSEQSGVPLVRIYPETRIIDLF